jgi:hypothetical protein
LEVQFLARLRGARVEVTPSARFRWEKTQAMTTNKGVRVTVTVTDTVTVTVTVGAKVQRQQRPTNPCRRHQPLCVIACLEPEIVGVSRKVINLRGTDGMSGRELAFNACAMRKASTRVTATQERERGGDAPCRHRLRSVCCLRCRTGSVCPVLEARACQ